MQGVDKDIPVQAIVSGKLRRYHGVSLLQQALDIPTLLQNIRDMFAVGVGFLQSFTKLLFWRPDVIFTKGGFVCLPVGFAAKLLRIPLVIHDSDAHPGLTNRILARWATAIATGAPLENYTYPKDRSTYVGIPISRDFHALNEAEKKDIKGSFSIADISKPLVVVTGGGLGAKRINDAIVAASNEILQKASIVHISGTGQFSSLEKLGPKHPDYVLLPFIDNARMAKTLGAADVVVTRAGATTLLELAALGAAAVIVPNAKLTGGHQLKNAKVYQDAQAAVVLDEDEVGEKPVVLQKNIEYLLDNPRVRQRVGEKMRAFARPDAAKDMANIIVLAAGQRSRGEG